MTDDIKQGMQSEDDMPDLDSPAKEEVTPSRVLLPSDIQTAAENTSKKFVPPVDPVVGEEITDETRQMYAIDFFLNLTDNALKTYGEVLKTWLELQTATQAIDSGKIEKSTFNAIKAEFISCCEKSFPEKSIDDISAFCQSFYTFNSEMLDWSSFYSGKCENTTMTNRVQRASGINGSLINAIMPGVGKNKKFSFSEMIRRDYRRTNKEPENFDSFLPNSFVHTRIARPDVLELSRLIKGIVGTVKGFVRSVQANNLTISRIAGYRVIFDYLMNKTLNTNIKDLSDFGELADVILLTDFKQMLVELTASASWEGVDFNFTCLTDKCNYRSTRSVDLKETVYVDTSMMTGEQAAAFSNMMNMTAKLTVDEAKALQEEFDYKIDNRIVNEDGRTYLVTKSPTMRTSFDCFDFIRSKLDPEVASLRNANLNNDAYEGQLAALMARMGFCEYIHWVDEIHFVPEPGSDEEERVYKRSENPSEFNQGLYEILTTSESLCTGLLTYVNKHAEKMSCSVVGVPNWTCPKCRASSSDPEMNPHHNNFITPYDPFMHFFTRSQLEQMKAVRQMQMAENVTQ